MSTRTRLAPNVVIPSPQGSPANSADMSQASLTSAPTVLSSLSKPSYAISWSGSSPVGTIIVQVSNDYSLGANGLVSNAGTWNTIPFLNSSGAIVSSFAVSGNTGTGFLDIDTAAYAIQLVYTKTSGTGTLAVTIAGKVS